jgi:putative glycerol-1-phosphate prenyltransferase
MQTQKTLDKLLGIKQEKGAGFFLLIDPDKYDEPSLLKLVEEASDSGVDAILIGGSMMMTNRLDDYIRLIKSAAELPAIIFPGSVVQVSREADAILYLSLVSGRNPEYLIGHHVIAAPLIQQLQLEPISTAYLLIESGRATAAEFMSNSLPIPRHKPELAAMHALAAEYLGMKLAYLEAGSGADCSVPEEMISVVSKTISIPLIVGGGIRSPEEVRAKVEAGASFVVVGNAFEHRREKTFLREMIEASRVRVKWEAA